MEYSLKLSGGFVVFRVKLVVMSDTLLICGQVCTKQGKCAVVIRAWKVKSQICLCSRWVSIILLFFLLLLYDMFERYVSKPPKEPFE